MAVAGGPALAHTNLVNSDPAQGATLDRVPDRVRLEFDEPVETRFDPVNVYDENGNRVDVEGAGDSRENPRTVVAGLEGLRGSQTYRVEYRVTAEDGDPTEGAYTFTLSNGARPVGRSGNVPSVEGGAAAGPRRLPLYAGLGIATVLAAALLSDRHGGAG